MRYRVAPRVAWVDALEVGLPDERIYLMTVPDGHPAVLNGPGALVFSAAASGGDVLALVAEATAQPAETLADQVATFLAELVAQGLLEPVEENP